jgi:hypothetical protein
VTRSLTVLIGAILVASGLTMTLQGLNILKGSAMSDQTQWVIIGPIVALVGAALLYFVIRRNRSTS